MYTRLSFLALGFAFVSCGGGKSPCDACGEGTLCDTNTGRCVAKMNNGVQCTPACGGAPTWSVTGDAGSYLGIGSCAPKDAGVGGSCVPNCSEGFNCQNGSCVLNGGNGPVQVTLRWNTLEDLDLHVSEPLASGAHCE